MEKKEVKVGKLTLGGKNRIFIQSMLNASPSDVDANVKQAVELEKAGCDILRVSIPTKDALKLIKPLKQAVKMPIVADIHFDYRLAIMAADEGIDKIRINPGNIGSLDRVEAVVKKCKEKNIPIRIGVNSGSLEKDILEKYGSPTAEALYESAIRNVKILEDFEFYDIVLSIKMSHVNEMIKAYKLLDEATNYPLHLGVTESGTEKLGLIKSAIGIGSLLNMGIGSTIRVSLTADPVKEIYAAKDILKALDLHTSGITMISCPTCGRTKINLIKLSNEVENFISSIDKKLTVAVMGCVVNGPGEAKEADIGIAAGDGVAVLFKKGEIVKKLQEKDILEELKKEILNI